MLDGAPNPVRTRFGAGSDGVRTRFQLTGSLYWIELRTGFEPGSMGEKQCGQEVRERGCNTRNPTPVPGKLFQNPAIKKRTGSGCDQGGWEKSRTKILEPPTAPLLGGGEGGWGGGETF